MPRIFMSYRRSDSISESGRIHDHLEREFGGDNVFKDVDDIEPGHDFRKVLDEEVAKCDVLLAIIGPDWVRAADNSGNRRLNDPNDFVRIEIESGLKREDGVLVVPVLIKNAPMPVASELPESIRDLVYRNAVIIRNDPDFSRDMQRLIDYIHRYTNRKKPAQTTTDSRNRMSYGLGGIAIIAVILILALVASPVFAPSNGTDTPSDTSSTPTTPPMNTPSSPNSDLAKQLYDQAIQESGLANYPEAIDLFTQSIEADSTSAQAFLGRGLAYASGYGDMESAIADFRQATQLDPAYAEAFSYLGQYLYYNSEYEDIELTLERAIELNPSDINAHLILARYYVDLGDYDQAHDLYETLLDGAFVLDNPTRYDVLTSMGYVESAQGDIDKAIESLETAIDVDNSQPLAYSDLGNIYLYEEDYETARDYLTTAIEKNADDPDNYHNRGIANLELQNYDEAKDDFDRALLISPNHVDAFIGRGRVNYEIGDYDRAIADFNQAIARADFSPEAIYFRGLSYFDLDEFQQAITDFSTLLDENYFTSESYAYRGFSYNALDDTDSAEADLWSALDEGVGSELRYDVLVELAWLILGDDPVEALELFSEAIPIQPNNATAYEGQADVFIYQGNTTDDESDKRNAFRSALDSLERGLDASGEDIFLLFKRGVVQQTLSLLDDSRRDEYLESARADFEQVIATDESFALAYSRLAENSLLMDFSNTDEALTYAQLAEDVNTFPDNDTYIQGMLGFVYETIGDRATAITYYSQAIESSNDEDEIAYYQGKLDALVLPD